LDINGRFLYVSTSQMCLLVYNYNLKEYPLFNYLTTLTIYNIRNNDKMCLFVILNHLWILNMHLLFRFHDLYCRHVWGVSKNEGAKELPVIIFGVTCSLELYCVITCIKICVSFILCKYIRFSVTLNMLCFYS